MPDIDATDAPGRLDGTRPAREIGVYVTLQWERGNAVLTGIPRARFGHRLPRVASTTGDGVFAEWHWDGKRLVVENDRYGFYPLFWAALPAGGICVAPSLLTLIDQGAPTELDIEALSVFFRLGFFVGDDTPFAAIRTVPPNAVFEWSRGVLTCRARYPVAPQVQNLSRDDAIDGYVDLFANAVAKRLSSAGRSAVTISGGRDSRHILLALHHAGVQPTMCVSALDNPPDANQDPAIAAELCRRLQWPHTVVEQRLSVFEAQLRKNIQTHFCAAAHGWYLALADFLNGSFAYAYDGIAGDVLSQSIFLTRQFDTAFRGNEPRIVARAVLAHMKTGYGGLQALLGRKLRPAIDPDIAAGRLAREIERHLAWPNPSDAFGFWNRTRREIALAPYALLCGVPTVFAPFLDHALFDFLTALPVGMLIDRSFHSEAIARAYPAYADVPYADQKHAAPVDDTVVRRRYIADAARYYALRKPGTLARNAVPRVKALLGLTSAGRLHPTISPLLIYLDQLEAAMQRRIRIVTQPVPAHASVKEGVHPS